LSEKNGKLVAKEENGKLEIKEEILEHEGEIVNGKSSSDDHLKHEEEIAHLKKELEQLKNKVDGYNR
jgi:hypothetical protein